MKAGVLPSSYCNSNVLFMILLFCDILLVDKTSTCLLVTFFLIELNYYELTGNIIFTFLFYYIFGYLFDIYQRLAFGKKND